MATAKPIWKMAGLEDKLYAPQWYQGRLCTIKNDKAWFIKSFNNLPHEYDQTKDVFMYPDNIPKSVLPVRTGDIMEFILSDRDKSKPMARKARIYQYSPRPYNGVVEYIRKLIMALNSSICKRVLVEILPNLTMWNFLASPVFTQQLAGSFS